MSRFLILSFVLFSHVVWSQVLLDADGSGDTYALITSVLAPGSNPIEVPDCNHTAFGNHIDQIFDDELNRFVFRFHIHVSPDDDRCQNFDRQRNEIKSYAPSPSNLLGVVAETVRYKWKFKLANGFQSSPNFTHLHQLKSVGGSLASMPMYTLTTRKGSPDKLELRYAETSSQVTLKKVDLDPFIGTWLDVTETIRYGISGTYAIEIKNVNSGEILFEFEDNSIINWRSGAEFVRPKWGIYRSLINAQDLRDEMVLFANFSVEELGVVSTLDSEDDKTLNIVTNQADRKILLSNIPKEVDKVQLLGLNGNVLIERSTDGAEELNLDIAALTSGVYVVLASGKKMKQSRKVIIY